jgi:putative flippase GtrA
MAREVSFDSPMQDEVSQFVLALLRLPVINRLGIARSPREFERFLKFAIVGAIGAVVDLSTLTFVREVLRWPLEVAVAIGFTVAVLSNFTWNRLWTFPESRERPIRGQLAQFFFINLIGLGINEFVIAGLHPLFLNFLHDPAAYMSAKIIAIGIVLFWNYFVNRRWTYKGIK